MLLESWPTIWRRGNWLTFIGVVQFILAAALSMWLYRGYGGYAFYGQFVSELGRFSLRDGESNLPGGLVFDASLCFLGLSTIPYFLFMPTHAPDKVGWLWPAAGCGVVSSLALAVIGATPYDKLMGPHYAALFVWVIALLIAVSLHAVALFTSRESDGLFAVPSLLLALLLISYMLRGLDFVEIGGRAKPENPLGKAVLAQKQVLLAVLAWYVIGSVRMLIWPPEGARPARGGKHPVAGYVPRRQGPRR